MRILVTGGTGFLGKRLGRELAALGHDVVLCGRNNKQNMMAEEFSGCRVLAMDVSHIESVRDIFAEVRPEVVIHAAATKFVDIAEEQPMEAIDVNVVGSQNVARVAIDKGVQVVIGVSTDKASPPIRNVYGLTKSMMERLFCALDRKTTTKFLCVRYGNVAWSTGSVLCIWRRMLRDTGVIGTTGPEMLRFFFTVDEAIDLVIAALNHADDIHGQVFLQRIKAAKIENVLRVWITKQGGTYERLPGRPGDRHEEFLVGEQELPFTRELVYAGVPYYVISFNRRADHPLKEVISSGTAERLSEEEIYTIITNPPIEEL